MSPTLKAVGNHIHFCELLSFCYKGAECELWFISRVIVYDCQLKDIHGRKSTGVTYALAKSSINREPSEYYERVHGCRTDSQSGCNHGRFYRNVDFMLFFLKK